MRWIKANERLPDKSRQYVCKDLRTKTYNICWLETLSEDRELYEWLDESPEDELKPPQRFILQQMIDAYNAGEAAADFDRKKKQRSQLMKAYFDTITKKP